MMEKVQAQKLLAESIVGAGRRMNLSFWRLSGDAANSLCKFLSMDEQDLKMILRMCEIYIGEKDNFKKRNFELLMTLSGCDYTSYQMSGKKEWFILAGDGFGKVVLPSAMYELDGELNYAPIEGQHYHQIKSVSEERRKGGPNTELLEMLEKKKKEAAVVADNNSASHKENKSSPHQFFGKTISPQDLLLGYVKRLVVEAVRTGVVKVSPRSDDSFFEGITIPLNFDRAPSMRVQLVLKGINCSDTTLSNQGLLILSTMANHF